MDTLFTRTATEVHGYLEEFVFPGATQNDSSSFIQPMSPMARRPTLAPQFKRLAAIVFDLTFQAPRRFFLQQRSGKQTT